MSAPSRNGKGNAAYLLEKAKPTLSGFNLGRTRASAICYDIDSNR